MVGKNRKIRVMVFGTFDVIHEGHRYLFKKAKGLDSEGEDVEKELIVVVARDKTVKEVKGRAPLYDEQKRLADVAGEKYVDKAVLGSEGDKYAVIEEYLPDEIKLGYDQKNFADTLVGELEKRGLSVAVERVASYKPEMYKSSKVKKELLK